MVSLVKKFKNMYKGSYYYANKKYGKYTKRRPFPNFNDFDCSPSGDFSLNEVPDMRKIEEKKNSYINTNNDNITVVNEGNNVYISTSGATSPATGDILGIGNTSNSVSPVSTISDNTDFTMINGSTNEYTINNSQNPFQSQIEKKNPFSDNTEISFNSGYSTTFDGMYASSTNPRDFNGGDMNRRSNVFSNDDVKYEYNGKNNWKAEIRRYYPTMPQTDEPMDYHDDFKNSRIPDYGVADMKKKKWWKKVIPSKKSKHTSISAMSENTYYDNDVREIDGNPKRYDSRNSSYYTCYNGERPRSYSNMGSTYNAKKYDFNRYGDNLTDGVLVVNDNYQNKKMIY